MNDAPSRITAGYDDGSPREFVFPAADRPRDDDDAAIDAGAIARALADTLTIVCGVPAQAEVMAAAPLPLDWQAAGDGSGCGLGGASLLAAALLNRQCGGPFAGAATAQGSAYAGRCRDALFAAIRQALLPDANDWTGGTPPAGGAIAFSVRAGDVTDRIDVQLLPKPEPVVPDTGWSSRLAAVLAGLAVPVRLVLHDGPMSVRAARALAVGDVLPIATAHEVGLRVGTLGLARGEVIDADGGRPRIRIAQRHREPA